MASESRLVSRWCRATFTFGLVSLACGVAGLLSFWHDGLLATCRLFALLTVVTAGIGLMQVRRQRCRLDGYRLALIGLSCPTAFFGLMSLMLWSGSNVRVTGPRFVTTNNLKQIGLAFHNYLGIHKRLPPAAIYDAGGRPLLSWRVALLPYLEEDRLYLEFKLDEPWDSPHNIKLLKRMPNVYRAPHRPDYSEESQSTFFQVFVGPGTPFEPGLICKLPDSFPDGTSNTILVVDAGAAVPWTKPEDIAYHPDQTLPPLGGILVPEIRKVSDLFGLRRKMTAIFILLADCSTRRVDPEEISEATLHHAIVRNDGKAMGPDW